MVRRKCFKVIIRVSTNRVSNGVVPNSNVVSIEQIVIKFILTSLTDIYCVMVET